MFTRHGEGNTKQLAKGITLTTLAYGEKTHMTQFQLSSGAEIPAHEHPHEQIGTLLSGKIRFNVGGQSRIVEAGDSWCFEGGVEHGAEVLADSVVIEVFSPLREDYL